MTDNGLSEALNNALDQDSFDVLEFVTGDLTPRKAVTIYTNAEAGYRLDELVKREQESVREVDSLSITDEVAWVDPDEVAALKEAVEASALTFHLKGLAPKAREAIQKELQAKHNFSEEAPDDQKSAYYEEFQNTLVAKSIERVVNSRGATDTSWSPEKISTLRGRVNGVEIARLDDGVFEINTDSDLYNRAVNADFLSKR